MRRSGHSTVHGSALFSSCQPFSFLSTGLHTLETPWSRLEDGNAGRRRKRELRVLSPPEAKLLNQYLAKQTTTLKLNSEDGVVNGLVARGILYPGAQYAKSDAGSQFMIDINLQPWAWKYLRAHPAILTQALPPGSKKKGHAQAVEEAE